MPVIALLSDIHANFEALRSVVDDLLPRAPEAVVCLGDVVGYGPQPQECVDLVREHGFDVLMGNHEQGLINIHYLQRFNQPARDALRFTREMLTEDAYQWLISHPKSLVLHNCRFVHGAPPDSVNEYIWKYEDDPAPLFTRFSEPICFVGHTHDLMRFTYGPEGASKRLPLPEGGTLLDPALRHIVNIGAVGQPRDGDNRAKYALFDTESRMLTMRFVTYDIDKTDDKIRHSGLHRAFADRLW